jgi:hypothetical protein
MRTVDAGMTSTEEEWLLSLAGVGLRTYSLCHMKNIDVEPVVPRVTRRHHKRGNLPPVRYHVLRLKLPRSQSNGKSTGTGFSPGVHPVAGHMAHYGNCCPGHHEPKGKLFGKNTGVYWVPNHLRGSLENGIVLTDIEAVM